MRKTQPDDRSQEPKGEPSKQKELAKSKKTQKTAKKKVQDPTPQDNSPQMPTRLLRSSTLQLKEPQKEKDCTQGSKGEPSKPKKFIKSKRAQKYTKEKGKELMPEDVDIKVCYRKNFAALYNLTKRLESTLKDKEKDLTDKKKKEFEEKIKQLKDLAMKNKSKREGKEKSPIQSAKIAITIKKLLSACLLAQIKKLVKK